MNLKQSCWCVSLLALVCVSCNKQAPNPVPYYVSCITRGHWQLAGDMLYIKTSSGTALSDEFASMPSCKRDDIYTLFADTTRKSGDMIIDEGPTKCDSSAPQFPQPLWWSLAWSESGNTFVISDHDIGRIYGVVQIDTGVIRLRSSEGYDPYRGVIASEEITYRRVP